jgi:chemotaxis protein MotB
MLPQNGRFAMGKRACLLAVALSIAVAFGGCTVMESTYMKKVNEADGLARELATLQEKYKELSNENASLKSKVASLSSELGKKTAEGEKLSADNKELENVLKAKSDSLSQTIMDLRGKISALESENSRLKQEVTSLQRAQEEKVQKVSKTYEDLLVKMKGEIAKGEVTISELKGKLTVNMVDAILFDSGKAEVKTEGQAVLQKVISILKDVKDKAIRTEGHTDNVPIVGMLAKKYPTNWELSAARALNVTRFLQEQGLDPSLLSAVAYGEYKPVAANDTPEGKQKNRRIEIILVPKE